MVIKQQLIDEIFKNYVDPEIGIDIWTLGLVYNIDIQDNDVKVLLTFTSPLCPYGPQMVQDLEQQIKAKGAAKVTIEVTFEPPWKPSDELREMLGV